MDTDLIKMAGNPGELTFSEKVDQLEIECLKHEQVPCPVYHHFSPGLYIREVHIPAGTFSIGHYQKTRHLNIFLRGAVDFVFEDGTTQLIKAPMIFTSEPGRKVGYIRQDMVWLNVYPTDETDVDTLEKMFLDKSPGFNNAKQTAGLDRLADRLDFEAAIKEFGFTEKIVREQSENQADIIPFPPGAYSVGVFASGIEGRGLFAMAPFRPEEIIAPMRIGQKRTPAGRFTNHAKEPNAKPYILGDDIYLVATRPIKGCHGGQLGDEITIDYRAALRLLGLQPTRQQTPTPKTPTEREENVRSGNRSNRGRCRGIRHQLERSEGRG